ncbi:MAG: Crp/Fnr family transcriptional regulator [Chloroflexota bacterium]
MIPNTAGTSPQPNRDLILTGVAGVGALIMVATLLLTVGFVLAAAALPIGVLGLLLVGVAWGAATGRIERNLGLAAVGLAAAIAGSIAIGWIFNYGLGVAFLAGGALFIGTVYELAHIHSRETIRERESRREQVREDADTLRQVDIFSELPTGELRALAQLGEHVNIQQGTRLGTEGQIGGEVFVILSGQAQLSANSSIGSVTVRVAGPGEIVPFAAMLGEGRLVTTVDAMTDMEAWRLDRSRLRELCQRNPDIGARIYGKAAEVLAERYRVTLTHLTERSEQTLREADFWVNV